MRRRTRESTQAHLSCCKRRTWTHFGELNNGRCACLCQAGRACMRGSPSVGAAISVLRAIDRARQHTCSSATCWARSGVKRGQHPRVTVEKGVEACSGAPGRVLRLATTISADASSHRHCTLLAQLRFSPGPSSDTCFGSLPSSFLVVVVVSVGGYTEATTSTLGYVGVGTSKRRALTQWAWTAAVSAGREPCWRL